MENGSVEENAPLLFALAQLLADHPAGLAPAVVTLLRRQLAENPMKFAAGNAPATCQIMVGAAAA